MAWARAWLDLGVAWVWERVGLGRHLGVDVCKHEFRRPQRRLGPDVDETCGFRRPGRRVGPDVCKTCGFRRPGRRVGPDVREDTWLCGLERANENLWFCGLDRMTERENTWLLALIRENTMFCSFGSS